MFYEREGIRSELPILRGQLLETDITPLSDHVLLVPKNISEQEHTTKQLIIVSGPPGSGKDTVVSKILEKSDAYGWPKTVTTREPRASEIGNDPYIRMTEEEFLKERALGAFMETDYHGSWYGSPKSELERIYALGKTPILRIDPNGAESILRLQTEPNSFLIHTQVIYAYVVPTNGYELYQRLMRRTLSDNGNQYDEALHKTQNRIKTAVMPDLAHIGQAHMILVNRHGEIDELTEEFLEVVTPRLPSAS
jgi:guanylate kinase